jgi:hypothetical protein
MGGWVDGWMGGWVDGWMGGWDPRVESDREMPVSTCIDLDQFIHLKPTHMCANESCDRTSPPYECGTRVYSV